jgi:hypothetical protein
MRLICGDDMRRLRQEVEETLLAAGTLRRLSPEEIAALAPSILPPVRKVRSSGPDPVPNRMRGRRYVTPLHEGL